MVYVISQNNEPLMPCNNVIARLLLKQGKAKVKKREPFTIKLTYETTNYTQNLTLGVDTGSSTVGTAVSKDNGDIVYMSEVVVRNDITYKMRQRSKYRRNRRNRKTRYRKSRWLNRKNSIQPDRFSPTMQSKLHSHVKEIEYIKSILPITSMVFETGQFDMHLMKNPNLSNPKLSGKTKGNLKYATQMNSIRKQLIRIYPDAMETFGYITKANRLQLGVDKQHYYDACTIAVQGNPFVVKSNLYKKKCTSDGDFQKTKGIRSEQPIVTDKICGFRKFDKVKYFGKEYFTKGRMSTGYAILMDIGGNKIDFSTMAKGFKTPRLSNCKRIVARSTQMIQTVAI